MNTILKSQTQLESYLQGNLLEKMSDLIITLAIEISDHTGENKPCACCNPITASIINNVKQGKLSLTPSRSAFNAFLQKFDLLSEWSIILHMQQGRKDMLSQESIDFMKEALETGRYKNRAENVEEIMTSILLNN